MASSEKALEVKASVVIGGEPAHATKIKFISSLNNIVQSQISYIHKSSDANTSATSLTAAEVFEALGERQTKAFKDTPDNPDTIITMQDAYGGSLEFKGNTSAPAYTFSVGLVDLVEDVQPDYAAVNCFDLTCYENIQQNIDEIEENPPSNVAELTWKLINKIMTKGVEAMNKLKGISKKSAQKQHEINQKVVKFVQELLDNSKDTIGWEDAISELKDNKKRLVERIVTALASRSGGFFNNILHLAEEFQCVYIPEIDNIGKLVNKKKVFEEKDVLHPHIISLSARAGTQGMFPVRAVAVVGVPLSVNPDEIAVTDKYYSIFPEEVEPGGSILQVQGPQWLPETGWKLQSVKPVLDGGSSSGKVQTGDLTPSTADNSSEVKKAEEEQKTKKENVLQSWAETAYYWHALGQSYAIINTELNLNVKLGKMYVIISENGETLFSGILNAVEHTISTSYSKSQASSNLQFSHVIMSGAVIPNIN